MVRIGSVVRTVLAILAAGCARVGDGSRGLAGSGESDTLDLRKPALVAYFFKSQQAVDTSESLAAIIDDMQYSLANDRKGLERHGVQVRDVYADTLRVRWPDGRVGFYHIASSDSDFVGYRLFRPDRATLMLTAVMTDSDLWDEARRYFGWKEPLPN